MLTNHPRIRLTIYLIALAAQIVAFFVEVVNLDLATAFTSTAQLLAGVAGVTAIANLRSGEIPPGGTPTILLGSSSHEQWPGDATPKAR